MTQHEQPYPYAREGLTSDTSGFAIGAFCASAFFALCLITTAVAGVPLAQDLENGGSWGDMSWQVLVYGASAVLALPAMLMAWVFTCVWLVKARAGVADQRRATAWVWLGWFVPIANFFVPFQVTRDLVKGSARRDRYAREQGEGDDNALLGWWWVSWLAMLLLDRAHTRLIDGVGTPTGTTAGTVQVVAILLVLTTGLGLVLWGLIIRQVVDSQNQVDLPR
ncbi:MAG: DUF4328 domain-containing protein [Nocardioides sp.]|nr:DUF4328 domain-containing protein [Nocardioides sp.]